MYLVLFCFVDWIKMNDEIYYCQKLQVLLRFSTLQIERLFIEVLESEPMLHTVQSSVLQRNKVIVAVGQ